MTEEKEGNGSEEKMHWQKEEGGKEGGRERLKERRREGDADRRKMIIIGRNGRIQKDKRKEEDEEENKE